jgi:hypothetical protein
VLEVPDKDAARVLELIRGIKKVRVVAVQAAPLTPTAINFLSGLQEAVEDVKRHRRGEIELQSWESLYAELEAEEVADELPSKAVEAPSGSVAALVKRNREVPS